MRIAFIGRLRSGKDAAAAYIGRKHRVVSLAFADNMKTYFKSLFPYLVTKNKNRRHLQQFAEAMREIDDNVWIHSLNADLTLFERYGAELFIIKDIRHENELDFVRENGFTVIKVEASEEVRIARALASGEIFTAADLEHETERACDELEADYVITNNGTLPALYAQIDAILDEIKREGTP